MKRSLRVVACILILDGTSLVARADDPYNYAEVWKGWSVEAKSAYLWGLTDGLSHAYVEAASAWLPAGEFQKHDSARVRRVDEALFLQFEASALGPVMTDLYGDPANAFIKFRDMAELARDKLKGSDIQERLLKARKWAVEEHRLMEQIKKK